MRGAQYKYINSNYLQSKLDELNIEYEYIKELAPNNDIRQRQKDADKLNGESKKQRKVLGSVFTLEYFYITYYPPLPTAMVLQKDCNAFAEIFRAHPVRIWCADSAQTVRIWCARNLHLHYAYNKKLFSGHQ